MQDAGQDTQRKWQEKSCMDSRIIFGKRNGRRARWHDIYLAAIVVSTTVLSDHSADIIVPSNPSTAQATLPSNPSRSLPTVTA